MIKACRDEFTVHVSDDQVAEPEIMPGTANQIRELLTLQYMHCRKQVRLENTLASLQG